jgi:hypothetical protein
LNSGFAEMVVVSIERLVVGENEQLIPREEAGVWFDSNQVITGGK